MNPTKILIVEDEAIVAEDIASCLEKAGYAIAGIVATGEEAIAAAAVAQPDLIMMDIILQGEMDGIQASQHIRTQFRIPVIYLTANADENTLARAKSTGSFGYILKPFKDKELRANIEIALSRHKAEVEIQKALAIAEARRQEAEEDNYLKTRYLSMASHEFRTPLSVIRIAAEMLQNYSDKMPEEKKQQSFRRIQAATDSMNDLLEDVLTLGQAESGRLELAPVPMEVVSFCEELIETLQMNATEEHILQFSSSESVIQATLDEKLLWHSLNNLLSNAIKYSPHGGLIALTLTLQGEQLCFQVQDQGIGIPDEYQKHLFEPFKRGGNVNQIPGTGLGLAIAKRSIDLQGGNITVNSEVGRGTTFTITLPLSVSS